jgi:hypothetical protein
MSTKETEVTTTYTFQPGDLVLVGSRHQLAIIRRIHGDSHAEVELLTGARWNKIVLLGVA